MGLIWKFIQLLNIGYTLEGLPVVSLLLQKGWIEQYCIKHGMI